MWEAPETFDRNIMPFGIHIPRRVVIGHCAEQLNRLFLITEDFTMLKRQIKKTAFYWLEHLIKTFMNSFLSNQ